MQRVADILVERGWAVYTGNPTHCRAKLLEPTAHGRHTVARLAAAQHTWANHVAAEVGEDELRRALATMRRVVEASRGYRADDDLGGPRSSGPRL